MASFANASQWVWGVNIVRPDASKEKPDIEERISRLDQALIRTEINLRASEDLISKTTKLLERSRR
jgi:hypothetical protein